MSNPLSNCKYCIYCIFLLCFISINWRTLHFTKKRGFQWFFELKNGNVLQYIEIKYL